MCFLFMVLLCLLLHCHYYCAAASKGAPSPPPSLPLWRCRSACAPQVTSSLPLGLPPGAVQLLFTQQHLLMMHPQGVALFNTSQPPRQAPKLLGAHMLPELWGSYGLQEHVQPQAPLLQPGPANDLAGSGTAAGAASVNAADTDGQAGSAALRPLGTAAVGPSGAGVLLPLGVRGVALFAPADSAWARSGGAQVGAAAASTSSGPALNIIKIAQPFVIVLMIVVGVWQYNRASNGAARQRYGRGAGMYGSASAGGLPGGYGLEALAAGGPGGPGSLFDRVGGGGLGGGMGMGGMASMLASSRQTRQVAGLGGRRRNGGGQQAAAPGSAYGSRQSGTSTGRQAAAGSGRPRMSELEFRERMQRIDEQMANIGASVPGVDDAAGGSEGD